MSTHTLGSLLLASLVTSSPLPHVGDGQEHSHPHGDSQGHYHHGGGSQGPHSNHAREQAEYQVVKVSGEYETRRYPAATWVCTNMSVDTAADPLAGLEQLDIFKVRESNRYKTKVPSSLMFHHLYDYIGRNNEGGVKIAMTRGGFTKHTIINKDVKGNHELQERCFYLEKKFQPGGSEPVPAPLDPEVYIRNRKEQDVLVRKYPGWIFTDASWQQSHERFLSELWPKEKVSDQVFYTRRSGYHWIPEAERYHEIWIPVV